ncbi:MAG: 50S ribosomal protein L40e [Candidatus Woesearchaeota archaeon]
MAKIPEAEARLFKNTFVCKNCNSVVKAQNIKVVQKKVKCRKCKSDSLKPKRKK